MIRFIEHDAAGNIFHVLAAPEMTIVPLVNMVTLRKSDGTTVALEPPVGITEDDFDTLMSGGIENFTYSNGAIVKKVVQ